MNITSELERTAEITWLGRLDGGVKSPEIWSGTISAEMDVLAGRFGRDEAGARNYLEQFKQNLNDYYVKANPNAPVRCIDGRSKEGSVIADFVPELGPQVPGGTPAATLSYSLVHFEQIGSGATIENHFQQVTQLLKKQEESYSPGAHDDNKHGIGCGAIAKMFTILEKIKDPAAIYAPAKAIAGEYFDERIFTDAADKISKLISPQYKDQYFMKNMSTGEYEYAQALLDATDKAGRESGKETVEILAGEHNEVVLGVNKIKGTTLLRDRLSADTKHMAEAFNYDFWIAPERAEQIFPGNEKAQLTIINSNVMYLVSTGMTLTDGSPEVGIRQ